MNQKRLMNLVLGIFLLLSGLMALVSGLGGLGIISSILAIAGGVLILMAYPKISKNLGWTLAAVYLLARGIIELTGFGFRDVGAVLAVLALAAGVLLLVTIKAFFKKIGFLLFSVWLVLVGVAGLFGFGLLTTIIPIVAILAGILLILDR